MSSREQTTMVLPADKTGAVRAAQLLNDGEVVALPSETVYGLAARCDSEQGIKRIFEVKNRPADNPLILHCDNVEMVLRYAKDQHERLKRLAEKFWPGPLTVVVKRNDNVPDSVTAGQDTVALRIPDNEAFREVISLCKVPIAAPSANISTYPSPTDAEEVLRQLDGKIPLILNDGRCEVGVESTIVHLDKDGVCILRPGDINASEIEDFLELEIATKKGNTPTTPGMKYRHYAPKSEVVLYCGEDFPNFLKGCKGEFGVVCFEEEKNDITAKCCIIIGRANDEKEQQHRLFKILNSLDGYKVERWYIHTDRRFEAIYNRLFKASQGKILQG